MSRHPLLTRTSLRVAVITTLVTGGMLFFASLITDVVLQHSLVSSVDNRLASQLRSLVAVAQGQPNGPPTSISADNGGVVDVPLSVWLYDDSGSLVRKTQFAPDLDSVDRSWGSPTTVNLDGTPFRVQSTTLGNAQLVIGQSLAVVNHDLGSLELTEAVVSPIVLILVFGGALTVGRRVGRPIEEARQRQLAFTADASHELRTPLSVIEAETSLALGKKRTVAEYRGVLERIGGESARLRHIVESLLWLARFDAAPATPGAESVDLGVIVDGARERFAAVAEQRHLTLSVVPSVEPVLLVAPPEWLDRLVGVLLDNACKYTPEGGQVRVAAVGDRGRRGLMVDDSGPGISGEERTRIFDRFARATSVEGGTGLGLSIADAIVRATNSAWEVGSSDLGGARFAVWW